MSLHDVTMTVTHPQLEDASKAGEPTSGDIDMTSDTADQVCIELQWRRDVIEIRGEQIDDTLNQDLRRPKRSACSPAAPGVLAELDAAIANCAHCRCMRSRPPLAESPPDHQPRRRAARVPERGARLPL